MGSTWEIFIDVALAVALAGCAGIRAWLPLFLAGSLARLGLFSLGSSFSFLESNRALILFGVATVLEIAADKIPVVDHALDLVSTVVRPLAGSLLAASVLGRLTDPVVAMALGVAVGAPSALVPHAAKSALRLGSTAMTAGFANPVLSLLEDATALLTFALAVLLPILGASLVLLLLGFIVARRFRRPALA